MKNIIVFILLVLIFSSCNVKKTNELELENKDKINGSWKLEKINRQELNFGSIANAVVLPFSIDVKEQKFNGFDSCNSFFGGLEKLTNKEIKLGNIASTRKACFGTFAVNIYYKALKSVRYYKVEKTQLQLFNQQNKEVLLFKR